MAKEPRIWTEHPGVYYVERPRKGGSGTEKIYYIVYRRFGKQIEEKAGGQYRNAMTPNKAARIRLARVEGEQLPNEEQRAAQRAELGKPTIGAIWNTYDEAKSERSCRAQDASIWKLNLAPVFASKRAEQVTTQDVDRLRDTLLKRLAPQTVKHVMELLRRLLNYAVKRELIEPVRILFDMPQFDNKVTETMTAEQMRCFLEALDREPDKVAIAGVKLALLTGARHGAICALRWEDVDFVRGFLHLRADSAKSGKGASVPLNGMAREVLERLPRVCEWVFPGKKPGCHRTTLLTVAKRAREAAGLPESFRPLHGLRHVFASELASSGEIDLFTLSKLLTHGDTSQVVRYAHFRDQALLRAADVMGKIVKDNESEN